MMRKILGGHRPDLTPAQAIGGIPIIGELLHSFGVYTLTQSQQDSLSKAVTWTFVLVGGDAVIRVGRNYHDAKINAAALTSAGAPPDLPAASAPDADVAGKQNDLLRDQLGGASLHLPASDLEPLAPAPVVVSDEVEFAHGAPPPESRLTPDDPADIIDPEIPS